MKLEHITTLAEKYDALLASKGFDTPERTFRVDDGNHLRWMCQYLKNELIPNNKRDKANRWLGFIQAGLAGLNLYDVGELRDDNRHSH